MEREEPEFCPNCEGLIVKKKCQNCGAQFRFNLKKKKRKTVNDIKGLAVYARKRKSAGK